MRPFACDAVLIEGNKILLIKRSKEPGKGQWAVPGGRIEDDETAEDCMKREMKEETGLDIDIIRLIGLYSDPARDPRKIIAASYLVKRTGGELKPGDDAGEVSWHSLEDLPKLAFDHEKIVSDALTL
jgi:8-oxo-dGTP diphosphatase